MDDRGASLTGCRPSGGFSSFQQRYRSFPNALGQQPQDTHVKMIAASLSQPRAPTRLSTIRTTKDRAKPQWEFPRLCRGGSKSLTYPAVDTAAPSTKLRMVSRVIDGHERLSHTK